MDGVGGAWEEVRKQIEERLSGLKEKLTVYGKLGLNGSFWQNDGRQPLGEAGTWRTSGKDRGGSVCRGIGKKYEACSTMQTAGGRRCRTAGVSLK